MSDENESGGIIGTIISLLILAVIWPYLLAILGLYIAYKAAIALLEWMAQNPFTVVLIVMGMSSIYVIYHYHFIQKTWKWLIQEIQKAFRLRATQDIEAIEVIVYETPDLINSKFIPSTNLYCYWCTRKLGRQSFERNGKYFCEDCYKKATKINIKAS